ncbi:MAG: PDDEXK nuclease domain-containing protein [Clostridiales bacterium]|nr:PDDEXK nuclease domain-containing protein [Clostridiales bacterium]
MKFEIEKSEQIFFSEIAEILKVGRATAYRAVNTAMISTYWSVGKRIVEREQQGRERADYGERIIANLSRYLGEAFGKGFSVANLRNFRQFYLRFPALDEFTTRRVADSTALLLRENATQCVANSNRPALSKDAAWHAPNLTWTHIRFIMRLDDATEREYYLSEAAEQNWSSRELERNIKSGYYRRLMSTQKGINSVSRTSASASPAEFIKDPYVLEFLDVAEDLTGKETLLESAIIQNLQKFLLEMGKGFSFVGRQMRISTETSHFYVDLVFYNYILKCFVVIDLKTSKLTHQDIGQMDMYVRMFDELKRAADDNPTLGILLCADKDETIVKYSVLNDSKQIFASKYQTVLPTEEALAEMLERENKRLIESSGQV